jgi:MoaA/NifB/PqqE/SkfB family radical SAM enzyme
MFNLPIIIDRIVFNYTDNCNLNCKFCYIPFDGVGSGNLELWKKIIKKCYELKPRVIVFAGGDPFYYEDFILLLDSIENEEISIQVDTNGLGLNSSYINIINQKVKLLSLPLDGTREIHGIMRNNSSHFDTVLNWINKLSSVGISIKVNTVVTALNVYDLNNIAKILNHYPIYKWSLYQFWPIGKCKKHKNEFEISNEIFLEKTENAKQYFRAIDIEISSIEDRLFSYFFVTSTGNVYVVDKKDIENYIILGNIFDNQYLLSLIKHVDLDRISMRAGLR